MMAIVARSARLADGETEPVPDEVVARGETAAEKFLLRWRGEADPRHVKAIDTYWICTAEHGLNASTFTVRVVASTGADCGAALSSAVGALSGPLHGGAPAYVKPMLEEVTAVGDPEKWVRDTLDGGKRIMGFGHRVYRAEDPRSRILKRTARELGSPQIEIAERLEEAALAELERRHPERPLKTNVEYYSALVLDVPESELERRLTSRRICSKCKTLYTSRSLYGSEEELCSKCGAVLITRDDDNIATIRHRLETYTRMTAPLIVYYKARNELAVIDGSLPPDEVTAAVFYRLGAPARRKSAT